MSKVWKVVILLSLSLNLVCLVGIVGVGERLVDAQIENLGLFMKLSSDQQALRRELNAAKTQMDEVHR